MECFSCELIANMYLNVNGRIDTDDKVIKLCCEKIVSAPGIPFYENPEETLERFLGLRTMLLAQGLRTPDRYDYGCSGCSKYRLDDWNINHFIGYVNLSMYPSPCQCKCCYCNVCKKIEMTSEVKNAYENLFEFLELADRSGVINPNALWQISPGEITIHPYRERMLNLVKGKKANFFTNAFIYDEGIAENLNTNSKSCINLSIDAGTPETWKKVKGVDNFDLVTDNLVKYYAKLSRPGQITLKYIVLPGLNDNYNDYVSVIEIMKVLGTNHLTISRDISRKYSDHDEYYDQLMISAAYLYALLLKNDMTSDMFTYTEKERMVITEIAKILLSDKRI